MGKKPKYPTPEKSDETISPLKGDRVVQTKDDLDFLSLFAMALAGFGVYKLNPTYGIISIFLLISTAINQKAGTSFLSNAKISTLFCVFSVLLIYKKLYDGVEPLN